MMLKMRNHLALLCKLFSHSPELNEELLHVTWCGSR